MIFKGFIENHNQNLFLAWYGLVCPFSAYLNSVGALV